MKARIVQVPADTCEHTDFLAFCCRAELYRVSYPDGHWYVGFFPALALGVVYDHDNHMAICANLQSVEEVVAAYAHQVGLEVEADDTSRDDRDLQIAFPWPTTNGLN